MSGTIPTQSSKASTAATDDMEITNYNELNVEEKLEDQAAADPSKLKKKLTSDVWKEMSRLTDPDGSTKAQCIWCKKKLYVSDDNDIVESSSIPSKNVIRVRVLVPYPEPWKVGSGSRILYPGGYGSGSGSKFHYNGTGPGLGVP
ncbi:hypothetical protein M9H77_19490 [Catharanthus roseus]|uniref:Uncharacterized protein n=1 Tax=Catharanthus roseus TaxID=4058 RepID=A0ACC0BAJ6_CATRO|nr:hypothetical protein M9H77_19490 [Catharanthus roseus]